MLADLRSDGDTQNEKTQLEYREIKATVHADVRRQAGNALLSDKRSQRMVPRTYAYMWRRYRYRVLIAMSAQLMAQLVRVAPHRSAKYTF